MTGAENKSSTEKECSMMEVTEDSLQKPVINFFNICNQVVLIRNHMVNILGKEHSGELVKALELLLGKGSFVRG